MGQAAIKIPLAKSEVKAGDDDFASGSRSATGQTTVNKKAQMHYIISINDMVYRPL